MYRNILVPLDGSQFAERALPIASALAKAANGKLILVRSAWVTIFPGIDPCGAQRAAIDQAEAYLKTTADQFADRMLPVEITAPFDSATEGILFEAEMHDADLIVMCTHARSGLGRWIFGSVAEAVLQRSPVPVLLVPASGPVPAAAPDLRNARVLVPLDGTTSAETVLPGVSDLARALDGTLVLLRAVPRSGGDGAPAALPAQAALDRDETEPTRYLARMSRCLQAVGTHAEARVRFGSPAEVILSDEKQAGVQMLAMTTHGRKGLRERGLGSVAREVVRRGALPVLLHMSAGARSPQGLRVARAGDGSRAG